MAATTKQSVAVLDYGMGNLHSVQSALQHVAPHAQILITNDKRAISNADRIIFPGVGAMRDCMTALKTADLIDTIRTAVQTKPILCVCLGMQALLTTSAENGGVTCLDIIPGSVNEFDFAAINSNSSEPLKVPHMGWSRVQQTNQHPIWHKIPDDSYFYFAHSYFVNTNTEYVAGICNYGINFAAALTYQKLAAVQFHPEKSHNVGLQLLTNFMAWNGE